MDLFSKLENYKFSTYDKEIDSDYLMSKDICKFKLLKLKAKLVNKGLHELYALKPKNPITFLGKWLLSNCQNKQSEINMRVKFDFNLVI